MASALAFTPRQQAMLPGGGLDRRVAIVKRALPVAAVATLGVVLALAFSGGKELSFVLSRDRVATASERLRVAGATYRGSDARGRPFAISAASAVQRSSANPVVELRGLSAQMQLDDGSARMSAPAGRFDLDRERLTVDGPVAASRGGYAIDSGRVVIDIARQTIVSETPVAGRAPIGTFTAGRMRSDVAGTLIEMSGGARLRIARVVRR